MNRGEKLQQRSQSVFDFAGRQLTHLVQAYPGFFPTFTINGKWERQVAGWTNWCEGFLGGQLWLVYLQTGDLWFREQAEKYTLLVEGRKTDRTVHDLGFIFMPTWKCWYDLSGDEKCKQVVIEAGRTLAQRFQEKGGYLCSFEGEHSLYIDIMMNVGLIFYAAQEGGDEDLWRIGCQHCLTTRRTLVRGDGSTAHEGIFETDTGRFLQQATKQGWRSDSTWGRGQAWALYGFGTAYAYTRDPRFLNTAEAIAGYYITHTPSPGIPPNDWEQPAGDYAYESSAAAIAAGGLWNLAGLATDAGRAYLYRERALEILEALTTPEFLASETPGWEGILRHGIYHLPKGVGVDESTMWGDYYLLESLVAVLHDERAKCNPGEISLYT